MVDLGGQFLHCSKERGKANRREGLTRNDAQVLGGTEQTFVFSSIIAIVVPDYTFNHVDEYRKYLCIKLCAHLQALIILNDKTSCNIF